MDFNETLGKKLDRNYARMFLNTSWKQHPTKQQLYGNLLPISQTKMNKTCWSLLKEQGRTQKQSSSVNSHTQTHQCWSTKNLIHQLCSDTGCRLDCLQRAMADWNGWRESQGNLCSQYDDDDWYYVCMIKRLWCIGWSWALKRRGSNEHHIFVIHAPLQTGSETAICWRKESV